MNVDLYAYLLLGLFFFVIWLACFFLRPDLRSMMLKVSIAGGIAGPLSEIWFFQDYWLPPTIVGQGVMSPEDVLFGFSVFGVAVAALPLLLRKRFTSAYMSHPAALFLFMVSFLPALFVFTDLLHVNSIFTASLVMVLWAVSILVVRRDMMIHAIASGALLAIFSIVIYVALLGVTTDYLQKYWLLWGQPAGITIFGGVPVTEIVWYFCFGAAAAVLAPFIEGKKVT